MPMRSGIAEAVSSRQKNRAFDLKNVKLSPSNFRQQFDEMKSYFLAMPNDDILLGFRRRKGLDAPGVELGGWYNNDSSWVSVDFDEIFNTFGQWLSAFARIYAVTQDTAVLEKADYLLEEWAKTIEPDGYFFYSGDPNAFHYVYEKTACGLVDLAHYAGLTNALKYLDRITDWAITNLKRIRLPATPDSFTGGDPHTRWTDTEWYTLSENLYRAYLETAEQKYKDFAEVWHYTTYWDALREDKAEAMSRLHGYSHVNNLCGAAMAYSVTGEMKYLETIIHGYDLFKQYQRMASGGYAPSEHLAVPNNSLAKRIENEVSTFEVPCGSWAVSKLTRYLLTLTGEARFGDWMERILYNAIGAALPMKDDAIRRGKTFYYADYRLGGGRKRYNASSYPCCAGTYPLVVSDYHNIIYFWDDASLYVNLFVPSTVKHSFNGRDVTVSQETSFPEEDSMRFTINCADSVNFSLKIRIPSWAKSEQIKVQLNGVTQKVAANPDCWMVLENNWKDGDKAEITIPMSLRFEAITPDHPQRVALLYGPVMLVMCSETGGLKGDVSNPNDWIDHDGSAPLHFRAKRQSEEKCFLPFYEIPENVWYYVYNDVVATGK